MLGTDETEARASAAPPALEALRRHLADAEAANQAKDRLMAILGHELRNPLSAICRALELMRVLGNDSRERAVIERQVRHMICLVEDLLDVSRIQGDKMALCKQRTDLAEIVKSGIETVSPLVEERQQRLEIDVPTGLYAMMDPGRMSQVVSNLLDNASKYSDVRSLIVITGERQEGTVCLKVIDQGMGIDAAMLPHVFESLWQQRPTHHRADGGLGLGLSIVRSIVKLHGGDARAHSPGPGKGSEFAIEIPGCG